MTTPRYARIATKILEDAIRNDAVERPSLEARARAIHAIERAIVVRSEKRRRSRWVIASAAAAAVVLLGVGATALTRHARELGATSPSTFASIGVASPLLAMSPVIRASANVDLVGAGADTQALDGTPLAHGKRLIARPLGHATLAFATGTELTLEERGDLTIDESGASQRFSLGAGAVSARVAKLAAGQTLVIATPDAEVEVHGTTFRVAVVPSDASCGNGTTTRVDVVEGVVAVNAGGVSTRVLAGEHWPSGCTTPSSTSAIAATDAKKPPPPAPSSSSAIAASQLAEQNDLFADALAAKRRGASGQAIATFDRFLAKYPSSPLAESASAERMRLLRGGDRTRAQSAARDYLARFPNGFARADAQAILADSP